MPRWPWTLESVVSQVSQADARLTETQRHVNTNARWQSALGIVRMVSIAAQDTLREFFDQTLPGICFACRTTVAQTSLPLCTHCTNVLAMQRIPTEEISFWPHSGALRCFSTVSYEAQIRQWIHRFKYPAPGLSGLDPGPARLFASLILEASCTAPRADMIVPIPLHPARLRARGFNPALLIAQNLAAAQRIPLAPSVLQRIRNTPTQTALSPADRNENVRGAFHAIKAKMPTDARIWLVDDVITTGSTLGEAARELRRAGAAEIFGISIARTPTFLEKNSANG